MRPLIFLVLAALFSYAAAAFHGLAVTLVLI